MRSCRIGLTLLAALTFITVLHGPATAAPEGTMTWGVHVTLASRWLDPAETEALVTPFLVLYALHDAVVKPMTGVVTGPSLAESWTMSRDGLVYEFVLRKNVRFHNGEPVTSDDVKFSFERTRARRPSSSRIASRRSRPRIRDACASSSRSRGRTS
jgi:ABC-type dipeptide transport system, periplasmic component